MVIVPQHLVKCEPACRATVLVLLPVPVAAILWVAQPACCAWPSIVLLTSMGLGAVFHTRFGRQGCNQAKPAAESDALPAEAMDEEAGEPDLAP